MFREWIETRRRRKEMIEQLAFMYDELNARMIVLTNVLVRDGIITAQDAVQISNITCGADAQKYLKEFMKVLEVATELGSNLDVEDYPELRDRRRKRE